MRLGKKKQKQNKGYDELLAEMLQELIIDKERGKKIDTGKYRKRFDSKCKRNGIVKA